jgi:hypothetical protein
VAALISIYVNRGGVILYLFEIFYIIIGLRKFHKFILVYFTSSTEVYCLRTLDTDILSCFRLESRICCLPVFVKKKVHKLTMPCH